jgi:hypothetical protein
VVGMALSCSWLQTPHPLDLGDGGGHALGDGDVGSNISIKLPLFARPRTFFLMAEWVS